MPMPETVGKRVFNCICGSLTDGPHPLTDKAICVLPSLLCMQSWLVGI
jgi:hypothetical protein